MSGYSGLSVDEMMMLARKENKNKQPASAEPAASQSEGEVQADRKSTRLNSSH